jgi:hypothetical protein
VRLTLTVLLFVFSGFASANQHERESSIAASIRWERLLFYQSRVWGTKTSLVDSPSFFLHPQGHKDPLAELRATLEFFRKSVASRNMDYCRFPARYVFLADHYSELDARKVWDCPVIADYWSALQPSQISLVFSSYYLNNPSSLMGHSFLRFVRRSTDGQKPSPLLDYALNFAAEPTTSNPILYSILGLTGGFPGRFSLMPYYNKVAEYAHAERRDLWEYDLDLSEDEVIRVFLSSMEVAPHAINYFYIDENCSYIMLFLLETGRDELALTAQFSSVVTPTDTIKAVYRSGMVRNVEFRPGRSFVFGESYRRLNSVQRQLFHRIMSDRKMNDQRLSEYLSDSLINDRERSEVLDSVLHYVEFEEKLVTVRQPKVYADVYAAALKARANNSVTTTVVYRPPPDTEPHFGHDNVRVGLGMRNEIETQSTLGLLQFYPSFHDIESAGVGFPAGLGIDLANFDILFDHQRLWLDRFHLIRIVSNQYEHYLTLTPSWRLRVGMERSKCVTENDPHCDAEDYHISGGVGIGWSPPFAHRSFRVVSGLLPHIGFRREPELSQFAVSAGGFLELQADPASWIRITSYLERRVWFIKDGIYRYDVQLTASTRWKINHEIRVTGKFEDARRSVQLAYVYAFF